MYTSLTIFHFDVWRRECPTAVTRQERDIVNVVGTQQDDASGTPECQCTTAAEKN